MSAEKKESIREGMRVRHTLTICSVALLSTMAYGLVEGHVGTAYRHRAQVRLTAPGLSGVGRDAVEAVFATEERIAREQRPFVRERGAEPYQQGRQNREERDLA